MGKPVRHRGKWRIRWFDENGKRESEVYVEYREAARALSAHETRVDEIRRGVRRPEVPDKTFDDVADYWLAHRVPQKRSGKHDESIIRRHLRPAFGALKLWFLNGGYPNGVTSRLAKLLQAVLSVPYGGTGPKRRRFVVRLARLVLLICPLERGEFGRVERLP